MRVWRCRSADVKVWRCRSAGVKVWRCRSADVKVWRSRSAGVKVWRSRSAGMRVWRCRSADVKVWRSRSADVKMWRCSITAAFLRRTLRRRSREKHSESRLSYLFAHLHLLASYCFSSTLLSSDLSLLSASALLCFSSVHIVGSLTSKLPSNNWIMNSVLTVMTIDD